MSRKPIKEPRRLGEVGRVVADMLQEYDALDVEFFKNKHASVSFRLWPDGEQFTFTFACTPRQPTMAAKIAQKKLERVIMEGIARHP